MASKFQFITTLIFLCCALTSAAQDFSLHGRVIDEQQNGIAFANVIIVNPDKTVILGAITDEDGVFEIANIDDAAYQLKVTFVGYHDYISDVFSLSGKETFPPIVLEDATENLDEVVLVAKKPTIVRKADRLVFNVENTLLSSGSTFDILKKTPSVIVNQSEILVRNQAAVIFLNDRKVQLSSQELKDLLESLDGNAIKSIEVLTNPSAKYDAESGAVLNIVTNKAVSTGYKGNLKARGTYGIFPKYSFGTTQYYKNDKVNFFFNYNYNPSKFLKQDESFSIYQLNGEEVSDWRLDFDRTTRSKAHNANLIFDYQLSEKQRLSVSANGFFNPGIVDNITSNATIDNVLEEDFTIDTRSTLNSDRSNLALDVEYAVDVGYGTLSANGHYTRYSSDRAQDLQSVYRNPSAVAFENVRFGSEANQDIDILTSQLDYKGKVNGVEVGVGLKYAAIDSQSRIDFFDVQNPENTGLEVAQADNFLYDEEVIAGYLSIGGEIGKWSLKSGLRLEDTDSRGTSVVLDTVNSLAYLEWFPSAYVGYRASDNHSFSFDYGRKLFRPRYQDLNPFAYFLNENTFAQGNPNLIPSFRNQFNLNYTFKSAYSFDLYYRDNGEIIEYFAFQDNQQQLQFSESQNALSSTSYGLDFTHGTSIAKWWYFYTYMSLFHEDITFRASESGNIPFEVAIDGFYGQFYNSLTLSKDAGLSAEITLAYFSKFISGSFIQESTADLSFGLRKSFWKKRAVLTVTGHDLLGRANGQQVSRYLNQNNGYITVPETQNVEVSFTYNFGNFRLRDNNRSIDKEERDRLKEK